MFEYKETEGVFEIRILDDDEKTQSKDKSLLDDLKSLKPVKMTLEPDEPIPIIREKKPKEKKTKKKKSTLGGLIVDSDLILTDEEIETADATKNLIDAETFLLDDGYEDDTDEIVSSGRKGYKKLKSDANNFKKEFAEELTLLYSLLDETSKYGDALEKDLKGMRSSKVRGTSKYSNDLANIVLSSKQTKLNILKEIAAIKKTIADLAIKESKDNSKKNDNGGNSNEAIASQYFKNILKYGRSDFIGRFEDDNDNNSSIFADDEEMEYNRYMEERLSSTDNPFRSAEGDKYIEYENRGVTIKVSKCIDTGEWNFIAVDNVGSRIDDYPLPSKKDAGRMRFSDDGGYCTDKMGRMYELVEYYLPEADDDYDEDDED